MAIQRSTQTATSRKSSGPAKAPAKKKAGAKSAVGAATGKSSKAGLATGKEASRLIDQRIRELGGWRGETLARMRKLILETDPAIAEEVKWNVPVWTRDGIICTGEVYQKVVKLTFARGASLPDPSRLFNSSLEGNTRRAIDIREGEKLPAAAFKALVKASVRQNTGGSAAKAGQHAARKKGAASTKAGVSKAGSGKKAVLLAGGNPQIAKAEGDAPVQAYIGAMPGWKREIGERLDALITRAAPKARKAVKWNSPFYGIEGKGWFLSFHVFTRYVKVTFFSGTSLRPQPPGGTDRSGDARWIDIYEDGFDAKQMTAWVKQAAAIPGWIP